MVGGRRSPRRRVLDVLLDRGEATGTIVAGELPVTRQAVAKHLAVLGRAGLVEGTRRGRDVRSPRVTVSLNDSWRASSRETNPAAGDESAEAGARGQA